MALVIELAYFLLATRYNIVDNPNNRSSHKIATITGAGLVFPMTILISLTLSGEYIYYWPLMTGIFLISTISFIDDIKILDNRSRIVVHFISVGLLLVQSSLFMLKLWILIPGFILAVGIINSYNFMDGINGMTAMYSLVAVSTVFYLSRTAFLLLPSATIFISVIAAVIVFSFFNVRKKAVCFSGDVGSISLSFVLAYLIIQLSLQDDNAKWILLVGVYGIDSAGTIFLRLIRNENITKAHRSHFYQFLVNEKKVSSLFVSIFYALIQLLLNVILITQSVPAIVVVFLMLIIIYILLRLTLEGANRLFKVY